MAESKIVGYKKIFGLVLPDWVTEKMVQVFVGSIFSMIVMLLLTIFYVRPMYEDARSLESVLATEKRALDGLKESKTGIDKLQSDITSEEQTKVLSAISQSYSPDTAIFLLRELADGSGVSIISYSLPAGVLLDGGNSQSALRKNNEMVNFNSYPIKIVISAPVDVLLKFINKVESSLPFGVVADLNLQEVTKLAKQADNKSVQIAMEIRYYQATTSDINISKIKAFTEENLETIGLLRGFDIVDFGSKTPQADSLTEATGSGNLFGI